MESTPKPTLRVHAIQSDSQVNGPGRRAVLHLQGCTLACPACFNPETHGVSDGREMGISELVATLLEGAPDGVSISGGEPFQQADALALLLLELRAKGCDSVLVFSGYSLEEIDGLPGGPEAMEHIDLLVAGRYDATAPADRGSLLSSANQRLHYLSSRYVPGEADLPSGDVEITIRPDGTVTMTGFPDAGLRRGIRRLAD